ncbi:hypothetical protein WA026_009049 [Henosepilachna vigintioctopunctata]|uniref:Cytochrome P450 n=1 Tax=Henosepilachna vigintioctopunctata TaxID=420089 RepID=A0AAW1UXT3_9CUCU
MEWFTSLGVILLTSIFLIWLWLRNKFNYWEKRGMVTPKYSIPWGSMREVVFQKKAMADVVSEIYRFFKSQNLKDGGIYFMFFPNYVTIDINIVKSVIQTDFQHFVDRGMYYDEKNDPLSAHLFSLAGKKWKLLRNKLSPTFTSGKMKMMFETLVDCTRGLHKVMDKETGTSLDIKDILSRFTTDAIGSCAFGLDCNSLENPKSEFREKGKRIFVRTFWENLKLSLIYSLPELAKRLKLKQIPEDVNDFFMNIVKDTVAYREKNNIHRKDFMHLLIQLKNCGKLVDDEKIVLENITEDENRITLDEIAAQAFIFFEAGFETSSATMAFCLFELAKDKNIQNKVREEIKRVLSKYDNVLTYDAAMEMHYLEQTINETLRKYPPLPNLSRTCTKDYKVPESGFVLEKGCRVLIPVMGIHYDPEFYPDPEKFDPDRFSDENKASRPSVTFLPFGEGPRICIGLRFGMMQTKVGLVALLSNYEFSLNEKTTDPLEFDPQSFMLLAKGGIWLDFKKLSSKTVSLIANK